jgi:cellulose synthase/poly-beta-1,6-N-acetylglucosamine synthase-like glycosyltransferase
MPTVSVIMPVWGAEAFIADSMASVLDQELSDLELILVDDRSPDASMEVAAKVAAQRGDTRVRLITRAVNGGVSAARNTGLEHATGEFVAFIDNDDAYEPAFLAHLVRHARTDPLIDIVAARPTRVLLDGTLVPPKPVPDWPVTVSGREAALLSLHDRISCFPWDKLYRRELFERLRFPEGILYEDMVLTTLLCRAAREVRLVPEAEYRYLTRAASQTWKDLPPVTDLERALAFLHDGLGEEAAAQDMAAALRRRRVLMTLILAQRALMRRPRSAEADATVRFCRDQLGPGALAGTGRTDPFLALAGAGLKIAPRAYGAIYRCYAERTYGMDVGTAPAGPGA